MCASSTICLAFVFWLIIGNERAYVKLSSVLFTQEMICWIRSPIITINAICTWVKVVALIYVR